MYSSSDLRWVKNVKRADGTAWAYMEFNVGDSFYLNWSKQFRKNASTPDNGELIMIFQTVVEGGKKATYLTHIVTPLSTEIRIDNSSSHPITRLVGVVAKATTNTALPKPTDLSFYRPNRGACCHLETIKQIGTGTSIDISLLQRRFWNMFAQRSPELQELFEYASSENNEEDEFIEGQERILLREHKFYERSPEVVKRAKSKAIREGRMFCEVCLFDFAKEYPAHGDDFIECHHKNPIAIGGIRPTTVNDLALVCSNCHRMLHRKTHTGKYLTVQDLKFLISSNT